MTDNKWLRNVLDDDDYIWEAFSADAVPDGEEKRHINALRVAIESNSIQPLVSLLATARQYIYGCAALQEAWEKGVWNMSEDDFLASPDSEVGCEMRGQEYEQMTFEDEIDFLLDDPRREDAKAYNRELKAK